MVLYDIEIPMTSNMETGKQDNQKLVSSFIMAIGMTETAQTIIPASRRVLTDMRCMTLPVATDTINPTKPIGA